MQIIAIALLLIAVVAILWIGRGVVGSSLQAERESTENRLQLAARQAVWAVEQRRKTLLVAGGNDQPAEFWKATAEATVARLLPDLVITPLALDIAIEAAVKELPKTKLPERGEDGRFRRRD